jgi:hypothetical protein
MTRDSAINAMRCMGRFVPDYPDDRLRGLAEILARHSRADAEQLYRAATIERMELLLKGETTCQA